MTCKTQNHDHVMAARRVHCLRSVDPRQLFKCTLRRLDILLHLLAHPADPHSTAIGQKPAHKQKTQATVFRSWKQRFQGRSRYIGSANVFVHELPKSGWALNCQKAAGDCEFKKWNHTHIHTLDEKKSMAIWNSEKNVSVSLYIGWYKTA